MPFGRIYTSWKTDLFLDLGRWKQYFCIIPGLLESFISWILSLNVRMSIRIFILSHVLTPCFLRYHTLINYEYALTFIFVYSLVKEALRKNIFTLSENVFFFSWEARNGGIILTREPEIIIVTYIYVPWAPQHICCDVYIRPVGFKGLIRLLTKGWMVSHTNTPMVEFSDKVQLMYLVPADLNAMSRNLCKRLKQQPVGSSEI